MHLKTQESRPTNILVAEILKWEYLSNKKLAQQEED